MYELYGISENGRLLQTLSGDKRLVGLSKIDGVEYTEEPPPQGDGDFRYLSGRWLLMPTL